MTLSLAIIVAMTLPPAVVLPILSFRSNPANGALTGLCVRQRGRPRRSPWQD